MDDLMDSDYSSTNWLELVSPGVYGVFDHSTKEVFIGCSNNLIKGIASVVTKIKEKDHVCSSMSIVKISVLYIGPNQRLEGSKIIDKLTRDGYKVLNKVIPISLSPRIRTLPLKGNLVAVVTLRSNRGNERIVAAFEQMADALVWLGNEYPNGIVQTIVYSNNQLTKECREHYEG